jgi:hypothetical protein
MKNDVLSIEVPLDGVNVTCYQTLPFDATLPCTYYGNLRMIQIPQEHPTLSKLQLTISNLLLVGALEDVKVTHMRYL